MKRSNIALAAFSTTTLLLAACGSDSKNYYESPVPTYLSEVPYDANKTQLPAEAAESIGAKSISVMTYNMVDVQGKISKATAMVMFPKVAKPADGYRTVVWAHGTVGVGDGCAPSQNVLNPRFSILAQTLLKAGYVIIAPDYEGLGTKGIHPYLNLKSESMSAIAAVKAMKDEYGSQLQGGWMSIGQSQGGHASLGIAEFANTDTSFKGAVAGAPASSLGQIIQIYIDPAMNQASGYTVSMLDQAIMGRRQIDAAIAAGEMSPNDPLALAVPTIDQTAEGYAELLAYAAFASVGIKAQQTNYDFKNIFTDNAAEIAELAYGRTGDDGLCLSYPAPNNADGLQEKFKAGILAYLSNPTHKITDYGIDLDKFKTDPVVSDFLVKTQPATNATAEQIIKTPVLIIQGERDQAVLPDVTKRLVDKMKLKAPEYASGYKFELVPNATHTQAIVCRNKLAVDFIQEHMSAGSDIVLTDEDKDASQSPHCKGAS
ncbi:alpha/beta hydrolase family protein [Acinetobacter haemolyticus]|uniref:Alpha/beta hydrolase n=1 Tax=Acinetobacter haemolyticus TaxID=29430 RepID=A0A1L6KNR7_ACIHA|nr:lipase family protein [Acinetobacter haemolyticus]APR70705.1 alpha/beta hydrolase [Acinetobacter haemolyticus]QBQ16625.1 alpha/beta hydrolase [Acinetobacter haemolyticus]